MKASQNPGDAGISPLISLRADLGERAITREDDDAVLLAALLRHAALRPASRESKRSLTAARRIARRMVSAEDLRYGPGFDEPGGRMPFKLLRAAADRTMRMQGNMLLASRMLDSLAALIPRETAEGGRLLAQRAATAFYLGDNELSIERYHQVARLGRKIGEPELVARGAHGVATARMTAGNIPEAEQLMQRAIALAGSRFRRIASQSILKLAIIHAMRGDFDNAVTLAWRAYQLARRCEADRRVVMLNLAQLLLDAGHPEASRAASAHLLRLPMQRGQRLAVMATHARAAGQLGDVATVRKCAALMLEATKSPAFVQALSDSLLECSHALDDIGRTAEGSQLRAQAREIALRHGYHDIAYMAEHGMRRGKPRAPKKPTEATQAVATEVRALHGAELALTAGHAE
jgi:tetratricopeptide (TPR) repeat protein